MQQSNRMKIFSKFVQSIKPLITKANLEALHRQYYIRQFKVWELDASLAIDLYLGIVTRSKKNFYQKNEFRWFENELRIFVWTICFYTLSKQMDISQMSEKDWEFFEGVFPNKPTILFQYQANTLLKNHNQYKKWVHEEDSLFEELVKKDNYRLRWSELGKALYIESNRKYFRTSKQCRQRWLNHLDPSKLKKYWLESQDFVLIQYVKFYGKKWALISKKLDNKRNEHSIKNRFKSLLTKQSKIILQPSPEAQLVDNIYKKLLKNTHKNKQQKEQGAMKQSENKSPLSYYQEQDDYIQEQPSIQNHPRQAIYQYEQSFDAECKRSKDILSNISLNSVSKQVENRAGKIPRSAENQVFEFSKLSYQLSNKKEASQEKESHSEHEKRVRADLFLQDDPFQLLKSAFYKQSQR